jgi:hypothetical protein
MKITIMLSFFRQAKYMNAHLEESLLNVLDVKYSTTFIHIKAMLTEIDDIDYRFHLNVHFLSS